MSAISDIDIAERHGVTNSDGSFVDVRDADQLVKILVSDGSMPRSATVSAEKARYLARKLYRLARRAEYRRNTDAK
jgi:F420-dependent methylenetetrahydromethanopterin dehydrogenase